MRSRSTERSRSAGAWSRGFRELREERLREVEGKTLLVVGLGGIGTEVAKRAHGLGMHVIATRNSRREGPDYVEYVGLADEYRDARGARGRDLNATPLTPETRGMFDAQFFDAMKHDAYLHQHRPRRERRHRGLSPPRSSRTIGGAGLDVTDPEPLPPGHPLWGMRNVIVTPHIATSSDFRNERTLVLVAENVRRYIRGDALLSVVDLAAGY